MESYEIFFPLILLFAGLKWVEMARLHTRGAQLLFVLVYNGNRIGYRLIVRSYLL